MYEMATYLSCRNDPLIAGVFAQFMILPQGSLAITERLNLLARAGNFNHDSVALIPAREELVRAVLNP